MMNNHRNKLTEKTQKELFKLIKICASNLKNSKECLSYLRGNRGLSEKTIAKYKIGFFPQNVRKLTNFVSSISLEDLNIIDYSGNSKFADFYYLVFPIFNEYGEPVGINGRTLIKDTQRELMGIAKYENSSFKKSQTLFGFNHARGACLGKNNVFICEGNFDVIQMQANGILNSVAICGTGFSKEHFIKLSRYTNKFTFLFDSDEGGQKAISRISKKFSNRGVKLQYAKLPEKYKDVDEFFRDGHNKKDFFNSIEMFNPELGDMKWK